MISDVVDALQARPLRRRWSDNVKAQIVAESYAPGAVVRTRVSALRTGRKNMRDGRGHRSRLRCPRVQQHPMAPKHHQMPPNTAPLS